MKYVLLLLALSGCGYSSKGNETIGQVKKLTAETPIVCNERTDADLSLGVIRNGVGSMSTEDRWFTVESEADKAILKQASETGALVKVTYNLKRWVWCYSDHIITHVELVK